MDSKARGRWAEDAAAAALEARGHRVLARNLRRQRGELDLVSEHRGRLWFTEVKSRGRRDRGDPARAIDARKRRALFAAAREVLLERRWTGDYGFLVVTVVPAQDHDRPIVRCAFLPISPGGGAGAR